MDTTPQTARAEHLRKLHYGPPILVLANVWDVASARLVEQAGFSAIATSSAAIANSFGYPDGQRIPRAEMLAVVERIVRHVALPVTADLESGYGTRIPQVADTARALVAAGAVGLNFEDGSDDPKNPLFDIALQAEKITAIRETAARAGVPVVINARTDVYLAVVGEPASRFEQAVQRANVYRKAGADCLFVPGVRDRETIAALVKAIEGPVNILAGPGAPSILELERLGVARVSFGSWPMRAAMAFFLKFVRELREKGAFTALGSDAIPYAEMNQLLER